MSTPRNNPRNSGNSGGRPAKKATHRKGKGPVAQGRHGAPAGTQRPPSRPAPEPVDVHDPDGVRLQKLLAAAGVGSRRVCEQLIADGRVTVDDQVVTELGVRIDPLKQVVHVDGERVVLDENRVYFAFNKPLNVVSTMEDDLGRESVGDFVGDRKERLFHVGRLDADTAGLLLLTNDGELANRLQHPRYGVQKTYVAVVRGPLEHGVGRALREGIELEDGPVKVDSFKVVDSQPGWVMLEVVLHEGRNRIVRRMLEAVGHPVESLVRTDVGPVQLGDLRPGKMRPLSSSEVKALYKAAGL
jgi:23S rRNA pseudouridine2605 synthase